MRAMPTPRWGRAALVLALIGATVGPVLDGLHTVSGTIWYPAPQFLKSVWWVPPLFMTAALAIGMGRLLSDRLLGIPLEDPGARKASLTMAAFVVAYALSAFFPASELIKSVLLLILAAAVFLTLDRRRGAAVSALSAGFGGWVVEHTLVGQALFFHRETLLEGIPLWLPPLYFLAAFAIGHLAQRLASRAG